MLIIERMSKRFTTRWQDVFCVRCSYFFCRVIYGRLQRLTVMKISLIAGAVDFEVNISFLLK